jgi:pimeloyl-ACP methyl ester carboxylesterase
MRTVAPTSTITKGTIMMEPLNPVRRSLRTLIAAVAAVVALLAPLGLGAMASADSSKRHEARPTIVLVHGDWADGSSWSGVIARLQRQGFTVVAPPNPLRGPSFDAPYLSSYLQTISGPIVLVAHSYGGFVITNAAVGNPNVEALVYIDSFLPDEGEDPVDLLGNPDFPGSCIIDPANSAFNPVPTPGGGTDLYLRVAPNGPYTGFAECFANGVNRRDTAVLAAVQRPAAIEQFVQASGPPAWKTIPSWSLIGTQDHVIPPALQEFMSERANATIETFNEGHLGLISRPAAVTRVIEAAVAATS